MRKVDPTTTFFLPSGRLPRGFQYPDAYNEFVERPLPDLEPWRFFDTTLESRFLGLRTRYPARVLVPFARRIDSDDVACFDASQPSRDPRVLMIHDFASPGWELRDEFGSFKDWLKAAQQESVGWKRDHT